MIRPFREDDTPRLVETLARVFAEYGMRFDPDGHDRDVREVAKRYAGPDAAFFALEDEAGRAVGFGGVDLRRDGVAGQGLVTTALETVRREAPEQGALPPLTAELHRLYLDPAARGRGLGARLCERLEALARERGASAMELWSDVRFSHAHALYARRGYALKGQRLLADPDRSVEFGFRKPLLDLPCSPAWQPLPTGRIPLADAGAEVVHRARMVAAAILDSRTLVRAGRVRDGGHELPEPEEVLSGTGTGTGISILTALEGIVVGFERGGERRLHPLLAEQDALRPCIHFVARGAPFPAVEDPEDAAVPAAAGTVTDAHVHLFPGRLFEALWRWFDRHAWPIRYRLQAEEVIAFLKARGVARATALLYAHAPGLARELNRFAAELGRAHPGFLLPLGTVLPGEPDAAAIVREALVDLDLRGIKVHCHVQRIAADDPRLEPVYRACQDAGKPLVIHAGREPSSPAYGIDTHAICDAGRMDRVLRRYPRLTVVVPHLGADEFAAYAALLERHENLWLDTTMAVGDYFPMGPPPGMIARHADRLIYGTDFPNVPYAWDRELRHLLQEPLTTAQRQALFSGNARRVFGG